MTVIIVLFLILNLMLIFLHKYISAYVGVYDLPSKKKLHKGIVPSLGGLYVIINFLLFFFVILLFDFNSAIENLDLRRQVLLIFTAIILFIIGFFDDKYSLSPNIKTVYFSITIFIFVIFDLESLINVLNFSFTTYSPHFNYIQAILFTFFCYFAFLNAFNMFDGVNFQSIFYSILFFVFFLLNSNFDIYYIIILISLFSILFLNINKKIFLGNSGTNLISFLISYSIINKYNSSEIYADEIFLLMFIPGIDMIRMMFMRIKLGNNPFLGDLNHIHHILNKKFTLITTEILIFIPIVISFISMYFSISNVVLLIGGILVYYFFIILYFNKH